MSFANADSFILIVEACGKRRPFTLGTVSLPVIGEEQDVWSAAW